MTRSDTCYAEVCATLLNFEVFVEVRACVRVCVRVFVWTAGGVGVMIHAGARAKRTDRARRAPLDRPSHSSQPPVPPN